ncbi:MAG: hypothetical protein QNJ70_20840 [Xenococcaceae cyanobacterium MO_207.B15]|nr:hypothetical protein [Xenococcaceae cyanobacterium MO_207.B15]
MIKLVHIPSILVGIRFAISPLLVLDALDHDTNLTFFKKKSPDLSVR